MHAGQINPTRNTTRAGPSKQPDLRQPHQRRLDRIERRVASEAGEEELFALGPLGPIIARPVGEPALSQRNAFPAPGFISGSGSYSTNGSEATTFPSDCAPDSFDQGLSAAAALLPPSRGKRFHASTVYTAGTTASRS